MKILFICYGLFPCRIGGVEIFNYHLIESLNNRNLQTFVITSCKKETGLKSKLYIISNIKYIPSKIFMPLISFYIIYKLRNKIDLIHAPYTGTSWIYGFFLPIVKKAFKIPYILMIHGGGLHRYGINTIRRFLFRNSTTLIGVSQEIKKEYEKRTKKKVILVSNLIPYKKINVTKSKLKNKYKYKNKVIFLFVGSIKKIKGIEILLDAFFKLGINYVKNNMIKLIIIGDGPLYSALSQKIINSEFYSHIKFLGFVDEQKKYEHLRLADVFVIPSYFEAQSVSLLDAMANECAIIGSKTKGISNIINDGENGLLFKVNDNEELKNKLKLLTENKLLRSHLAKSAKEYYDKHYNYIIWLEEMLNIYKKTIQGKNHGFK